MPCSSPKMPGLDFGRLRSTSLDCRGGLPSPVIPDLRVGVAAEEPGSLAVPVRGLAGFGAVPSSSVGGAGEEAAGGAGWEAAGLDGAERGMAPSSDSLLDDVGGEVAGGVAADLD